ncbi:MAG TPA: ATP-binding cassette domain-containing protein [Pseudomonadales bacterium]|nr:ATP-binding cassette domain-containing protein [Pseudomonadales bacterium]
MIALKNIVLLRGVQRLLDNASLTIHPGRHIGVIGRNGCGKSSLFQLLLGQLQLDGGDMQQPANWRIAHMAQEVSSSDKTALDYVLDGDADLRRVQRDIARAEEQGDNDRLGHLYAELETLHGYDAEYRGEQLLHGLGFNQSQVQLPVNSFSGGWRIRLNLAQALVARSDLLLLDEPTNHLDLDATLWLEDWLKAYPGTLLIISHDRDFLDNVVDEIVHIENARLNSYRGNYSSFETLRAMRLAEQQADYEKQQRRIAEIENFVRRFRAQATKARQAQSRLKELERMEQISLAHVDSPFHFTFRDSDKTSSPLLVLREAAIGYGDNPLLQNVNINLQPGSRIGLLGVNGAGKSTLIKALVGELALLQGERVAGEHLAVGYFAQHQLEALDIHASALLHIQRISPAATEQAIRNFLGGFDFHGDKALEPIEPFSGGEKARLALALVVWHRPNLLLLDEPTNHLDLEMREALTEALLGYNGALVVISHDRHLLRNAVDEFWRVHGGRVEAFDGTLDDYHQFMQQSAKTSPASPATVASVVASLQTVDKKALRQQAAQQRQLLAPLKKQIDELEKGIAAQQARLAEIDTALADPLLYEAAQKSRMQALLAEQGVLRKQIDENETRWFALQEQLEQKENLLADA